MINRLYVHNFRCLENFELRTADCSSLLLIGRNGAGKTTVGMALEILQRIARGTNRVSDLVKPKDLTRGRTEVPLRLELEVKLAGQVFEYAVAFELPPGFKELRVAEEGLKAGGQVVFARELAQVRLPKKGSDAEARFPVDWHLVALPIVQGRAPDDPLSTFKQWLARMLILRPLPGLIAGDSSDETLQPNKEVTDLGAWFTGLLAYAPAAYAKLDSYLKAVMPDIRDVKNPQTGKDSRSLVLQFTTDNVSLHVPFADLSDGEKCFMICALVLAANETYGPLCCFWDEPDIHLALSEVGHFVLALRKGFHGGGQFIATSHNPEAIQRFSDENTLVLHRRSHLEPTQIKSLKDIQVSGSLVSALARGDVIP